MTLLAAGLLAVHEATCCQECERMARKITDLENTIISLRVTRELDKQTLAKSMREHISNYPAEAEKYDYTLDPLTAAEAWDRANGI